MKKMRTYRAKDIVSKGVDVDYDQAVGLKPSSLPDPVPFSAKEEDHGAGVVPCQPEPINIQVVCQPTEFKEQNPAKMIIKSSKAPKSWPTIWFFNASDFYLIALKEKADEIVNLVLGGTVSIIDLHDLGCRLIKANTDGKTNYEKQFTMAIVPMNYDPKIPAYCIPVLV